MTVPTASMRAGNIQYPNAANGGSGITTLNPTQIASMDPSLFGNGTCPWGPGVDPNVLAVLNQYPLPNGYAAGDGLNTASYTWPAPNPASLNTYIARFDYIVTRAQLALRAGQSAERQAVRRAAVSRPARQLHHLGQQQGICRGRYLERIFQSRQQSALRFHPAGNCHPRHRPGSVRKLLQHQSALCRDQDNAHRRSGATISPTT